ncbi:hypothetical protein [Dysgonomonas mossii]|uniref:hypothetical protein n=1 Tax=Dysgonomonas mossii TaxID=163665 RepID=UPI0039963319
MQQGVKDYKRILIVSVLCLGINSLGGFSALPYVYFILLLGLLCYSYELFIKALIFFIICNVTGYSMQGDEDLSFFSIFNSKFLGITFFGYLNFVNIIYVFTRKDFWPLSKLIKNVIYLYIFAFLLGLLNIIQNSHVDLTESFFINDINLFSSIISGIAAFRYFLIKYPEYKNGVVIIKFISYCFLAKFIYTIYRIAVFSKYGYDLYTYDSIEIFYPFLFLSLLYLNKLNILSKKFICISIVISIFPLIFFPLSTRILIVLMFFIVVLLLFFKSVYKFYFFALVLMLIILLGGFISMDFFNLRMNKIENISSLFFADQESLNSGSIRFHQLKAISQDFLENPSYIIIGKGFGGFYKMPEIKSYLNEAAFNTSSLREGVYNNTHIPILTFILKFGIAGTSFFLYSIFNDKINLTRYKIIFLFVVLLILTALFSSKAFFFFGFISQFYFLFYFNNKSLDS